MKRYIIASALTLCTTLVSMDPVQLPQQQRIYRELKRAGYAVPTKQTNLAKILSNKQTDPLEIRSHISNAWNRHNELSLQPKLTQYHVKDATEAVLKTAIPKAKL